MAFDAHKNFAISTVATAPSPASSGTSLVVAAADGAKFPAAPFDAVIWPTATNPTTTNAEVVRVTAISTDTFTITRAAELSSARTVVVGDQIAACLTAKTLTDIEALFPVPVANGGTGVTVAGATLFASPANPTVWSTTQSASFLMMGLNQTITPAKSGTLLVLFAVNPQSFRTALIKLQYGTGGAPANQAALTGSTLGAAQTIGDTALTGTTNAPIPWPGVLHAVVTGLSVGTTYWLDLALQAASATNFSFHNAQAITVLAVEL